MATSNKRKSSAAKRNVGTATSGQFVMRSNSGSFVERVTVGRDSTPPRDRPTAKKPAANAGQWSFKKSDSGGRAPGGIDRPFDADVLRRAREIADGYQVVVRHEDGEYVGRGLEMPECLGTGATPGACVEDARDLMTTAVAVMLEDGETPPPPASEGARTEQVNIRFSAEEKLALETLARQGGFRGVSDYVRSIALVAGRYQKPKPKGVQ